MSKFEDSAFDGTIDDEDLEFFLNIRISTHSECASCLRVSKLTLEECLAELSDYGNTSLSMDIPDAATYGTYSVIWYCESRMFFRGRNGRHWLSSGYSYPTPLESARAVLKLAIEYHNLDSTKKEKIEQGIPPDQKYN